MKTLKCDLCEITEIGESFEEWIIALHQHYTEVHPEVMEAMNDPKHTEEEKKKWIMDNKARFDAA